MIQEFNNLPWHDAELREIIIDRNKNDIIKIIIRWPESFGGESVVIEFFDCYAFQSNMHFGIVPPDSILEAECLDQSQELEKIKAIWLKMGIDISNLYCYRINTNSTNSTILIFALGFRIHL